MTMNADYEIKSQVTEKLPCKLTIEELAGLAQSIGQRRREIMQLESEKSQATDRLKSLIQGAQAQADDLAEQAASGVQLRDVLVHEVHHYRTGNVVRVRPDTQEVLSQRAMTPDERQRSMGFADPERTVRDNMDAEPAKPGKGPRVHGIKMLPQRAGETAAHSTDIDGQQVLDQLPDEPGDKPKHPRKGRGTKAKRGGK